MWLPPLGPGAQPSWCVAEAEGTLKDEGNRVPHRGAQGMKSGGQPANSRLQSYEQLEGHSGFVENETLYC